MALDLPLRALAPAKLNLCLYVGDRRRDGLHEICSIFLPLTLADELVMERAEGASDEIVCPGVEQPNLAAAALARFRERFGWDAPPVRLQIEKRIPVAAGLGGGSADAAATLRLAAAAAGSAPSRDEMTALAAELGADVPSQLEPAAMLVTGAGERTEPIAAPERAAILLVASRAALRTADVYARADQLGLPDRDLELLAAELYDELAATGVSPPALAALVHNELEPAALELAPAAREPLALLRELGALAAGLSGSGPSTFGLFADLAEAEQARQAIAPRIDGIARVVSSPTPPGYADPEPATTVS